MSSGLLATRSQSLVHSRMLLKHETNSLRIYCTAVKGISVLEKLNSDPGIKVKNGIVSRFSMTKLPDIDLWVQIGICILKGTPFDFGRAFTTFTPT